MSVLIRSAVPGDHARITQVEDEADRLLVDRLRPDVWEGAPPGSSRTVAPEFVPVVEDADDDGVVELVHVLERDGIAHLEQLSVLPEHGRRGHGRRLVQVAMAEARSRGHDRMTLRSYADVPWNAPFYARLGFVESTPEPGLRQHLVEVEQRLGPERHGRRVQMTVLLSGVR